MIQWDPISPLELLQSGINWAPRLGSDTIASGGSSWSTVSPPGPTATFPSVVGQVAYIWIDCRGGKGVPGTLYTIINTVLTNGGQVEVETATFECVAK